MYSAHPRNLLTFPVSSYKLIDGKDQPPVASVAISQKIVSTVWLQSSSFLQHCRRDNT